jgi:predicted phage terminase large subunit-like protein
VYIPALPDDNPHGDIEAYRESLAEMSPVDRARIETGNWSVAEAGAIIPAERIVLRDAKLRIKDDDEVVRAWDLAATPPTSRKPDPDWTVGIKMVRREHRFVIVDVIRFRAGPGKVRQVILSTAALDGLDCAVVLPQDPAQAGKDQALRYRRDLRAYRVETIPVSGDKATRASPFASAVEDGDVEIAPGPWRPTLVNELALFDGTGSGGHDDQVDAVSSAFGHLTGRSYARIRRL